MATPDLLLVVNPREDAFMAHRRKRRRGSKRRGGFKTRSRRLTNPRFRLPSVGGIGREVTPAIIGAGGALALDVGMAYLPLPEILKSGWGKTLGLLIGSLGLGFVLARVPFVGRRNAQLMTAGALTIVAYGALKPLLAQTIGDRVKGLNGLADFGDYSLGAYMQPRLGAYMNPAPALLATGGGSPIAAKQMGAYMGSTGNDYF